MRCASCTNTITLNEEINKWEDPLGDGCVVSSTGEHTPVGEPLC